MQREQLVKRCWEPEVDLWTCRPKKRVRLEAGLPDGGGPMEMLPALVRIPREEEKRGGQVYLFRPGSPPLSCVRCLAGEPVPDQNRNTHTHPEYIHKRTQHTHTQMEHIRRRTQDTYVQMHVHNKTRTNKTHLQ